MRFLRRLLRALLYLGPLEILVALLRLLLFVVLFAPVLLLRLLELMFALVRQRNLYPERPEEPCRKLPEAIVRRPDPAIYSQRLLMAQGLPVTWNNPDIWMARADDPTNVEPDSYHLEQDTDYIVSVRVHNASTDAAIGVRVRLSYRPWSFNSPDLVPVEVDSTGNEVFRFVDLAPMGATVTQFRWHTPALSPGEASRHFCLQASLYHPLDTNLANNMGQENTNVVRTENPGTVRPGQVLNVVVPLFNRARAGRPFTFSANTYRIADEDRVRLHLQTTRGRPRWTSSRKLANLSPAVVGGRARGAQGVGAAAAFRASDEGRRLTFRTRPNVAVVKNRYGGFDHLRDKILGGDHSLPRGMRVAAEGMALEEPVMVESRQERLVHFSITVPDDAPAASRIPVNLVARSADGVLAGGVTLILEVEGG